MGKETGVREKKYARHWMILRCLPAGVGGRRVDEIAEEIGCSVRTAYRDLEMLQLAGFPIEWERVARGKVWRLSSGYRDLPPMPFGLLEATALVVAERRLRAGGDHFFSQLIGDMLGKLSRGRGAELGRALENLEESFAGGASDTQRPRTAAWGEVRAEWLESLARGIRERLKLRIDYRDSNGRQTRGRVVAPLRFWVEETRTYLLAYCYLRRGVRTFELARLRRVDVTGEVFVPEWELDPDRYVRESFGAYHARPEEVVLEFDGGLENYLRERPLHESQELVLEGPERREGRKGREEAKRRIGGAGDGEGEGERSAGWVRCRLRVGISEPLLHELVGFGARLRVVRPERLRALVAERHWEAVGAVGAATGADLRLNQL